MMDPRERVKYEFVRYTRGTGLDLGVGPIGSFPQFIKVRREDDVEYKASGAHYLEVADFARLDDVEDATCDFVVAAAVMFSGQNPPQLALAEWLRVVKVGGHVCIYEPEPELEAHQKLAHVAHEASAFHPVALERLETWPAGGTYMVIRKRDPDDGHLSFEDYSTIPKGGKPEKTACVVRHGGIGDQIQAAFLLPELKRQGYHLTVLTTERCQSVIAHDPHVDEWFIIDHDHVPAGETPFFWRTIARHYTKFVNLNESVEGTFLPPPGRPAHAWPHALRNRLLNHNYAEFAAALAEILFVPEGQFWPSAEENAWVDAFLGGIPLAKPANPLIGIANEPVFTILWALSGSSPHKFTPHQDNVINLILTGLSRAVIIMAGDELCKILECGWEDESRVIRMSGELDLRKTLALARRVDLVIGPETGVLNSVAYTEDVRKVVMLSHSSHENLTKHWKNTVAIEGVAPCYPCHRLHFTSEFCPQDPETHTAICQKNVNPGLIYHAIDAAYTSWAKVQLLRKSA